MAVTSSPHRSYLICIKVKPEEDLEYCLRLSLSLSLNFWSYQCFRVEKLLLGLDDHAVFLGHETKQEQRHPLCLVLERKVTAKR